jgi:hypothetical protein
MWKRTLFFLVVAALVWAPTSAYAATPPSVSGPNRASAPGGHPSFTWRPGPAGEQVTGISIGPADAVDDRGRLASTSGGVRLEGFAADATSARSARALHAGRYFWTADWASPDAAASGATPVAAFTVPPVMRSLRGRYVQHTANNRFSALGTFVGNAWRVRVTCSVFNGRKLVSRQRLTRRASLGRRTSFTCGRLRVPENLDGARIRLHVVARGANRHAVAVTSFRAT